MLFGLSQMQNANCKSHEGNCTKLKIRNRQLTKASFAKLTLEGEGDAFLLKLKSHVKATHQTKNLRIISLLKLALLNQRKRAMAMISQQQ
jgi:hypothetical protein